MRTRPDLRTATIIRRGFFAEGLAFGGGGVDGYAASSMILICVIYDSNTVVYISSLHGQPALEVHSLGWQLLQAPSSSIRPKQL